MKLTFPFLLAVAVAGTLWAADPVDEFELVESRFGEVGKASGGEFEVELQLVAGAVPDSPLTGDEFSLEAPEFWSFAAVVGEPPKLTLEQLPGGALRLSWGDEAGGHRLESSTSLNGWAPEGGKLSGAGSLEVQPAEGQRFFRLVQ